MGEGGLGSACLILEYSYPREWGLIFDAIIFSLQIRRSKFDAIIHLPLCKGVTIPCYNIITPRGRKFIAGVNISQLYFHPGVVILWG